ncbi:MAG: head-tail connector protein [Ruminococcus sp.]|nr:head-tail connector protein [Ruminococcus sp.]
MLEEIKKMQGINHNDFDNIIQNYIDSAKLDLKAIGIAKGTVDKEDSLIKTAILTYALSFLDVNNSEMYSNSYVLQKDVLRHLDEYQEKGNK